VLRRKILGSRTIGGPLSAGLLLAALLLVPGSAAAVQRPFHLTVFGGLSAGGTLYTASTTQADHIWTSPLGEQFGGERVKTSLNEDLAFGLRLGKGFADRFAWNLSVAFTGMGITADVLTAARNADSYRWDNVNATFLDLAVTWDWSREKNSPYFLAGIGYANLSFEDRANPAFDLDQNGIEYVLGGGMRWNILQVEARDHLVPTDFGPEEARLAVEKFDGKDLVQFWEISLGVVLEF